MKTRLLLFLFLCSLITTAQTNLIPNGNFENWSSSTQPDSWYQFMNGYISKSAVAQNGSSSVNMKVESGNFNYINTEFFPAVANKTYRITMYHKLVSGTFSTLDFSVYHKPGAFKEEITKKTDVTFSTTEWRKIEFEYTPTISENIEIDIWATGTLNSEILIDNVSVVDIADVPASYTLIPDTKFEAKLIALKIDDVADGKVLTSKINKLTELGVSYSSITDLTGIQDFAALKHLICNGNQLTSLDISKNIALTNLNCENNSLAALDLTSNTALEYLNCGNNGGSGNKISTLNLSKNTNLIDLTIRQLSSLTTIDLSKNVALKSLSTWMSNISTLDLSKNTALETLSCPNNKLSSLNLNTNILLKNLDCSYNQLTTLDVSNNKKLVAINCNSNNLSSLNLQNGNNLNFKSDPFYIFSLKNNPNLNCIKVDDSSYSNTNWSNLKDYTAYFSPLDCASAIKISDPNFEDKLIALGIDTDGKNGVVSISSINTVTSLDVSNSSITDLTGIQGFTVLTTLNASNNLLKKIDLSKNPVLTTLNTSNNPTLTCIQVVDLSVAANWATTKDAIANFNLDCETYTLIPDSKFEEKLIALQIDKDGLNGKVKTESILGVTNLDLSASFISNITGIQDFTSLTQLQANNNQITTADFSKNTQLNFLRIYNNQLTTIDVSKNIALTSLECYNNKLTSLDVTNNTLLVDLSCYSNQLNNLDLTKNTALYRLLCNQNNLSTLNLKNGKNTLLTTNNINLTGNPTLSCISVDDLTYSNSNWTNKKDATASYTIYDCSTITTISDTQFEDKLIALGIDTDGKNKIVLNSSISTLTSLDVSNSSISNLKGIEGFTALKILNTSGNLLKKLDLSKNTALTTLNCSNNASLTCIQVADVENATNNWTTTKDAIASFNLDCGYFTLIPDPNFEAKLIALKVDNVLDGKVLTENIATLTSLNVYNNSITDLTGIQNFVSLETLNCSANKITTLDLSNNLALKLLQCDSNDLTSLNVSKNIALEDLNCNWNDLKTLDLSKNINLIMVDCYNNKIAALDVKNSPLLKTLKCSYNEIATIDLSNNKSLTNLYLTYNKLSNVDLSQNTLLTEIGCFGNNLETLDLSKNTALITLSCGFNNFKQIDLSKNINLKSLSIENSYSIEKLDLSKNINLEELYCYTSNFKSINLKNGKNTLLKNDKVNFKGNNNLPCIEVDDVSYSNANWTQKEAKTSFNLECTYTLPVNNFIIQTKSESCLGENNGEISIVATATQNYIATINEKPYNLVNKSLKISNLTPGNYTVIITIPGETFEQNFNIVIAKGATITGKSTVSSKKVNVAITDGTAPYTVFVNGIEQFETNDSNFSLTARGGGLLEVKTAKACEGVYTEDITGLDLVVSAYPNPTSGSFEIELPVADKEVTIEINALDGRVISSKKYSLENGTAQLTLENQPKGIYIAKIHLAEVKSVKIIKN